MEIRKGAGEDKIRLEMLKIMKRERVRWLIGVCQVACKLGKAPKDWQTNVIIPTVYTRNAIVKSV